MALIQAFLGLACRKHIHVFKSRDAGFVGFGHSSK